MGPFERNGEPNNQRKWKMRLALRRDLSSIGGDQNAEGVRGSLMALIDFLSARAVVIVRRLMGIRRGWKMEVDE